MWVCRERSAADDSFFFGLLPIAAVEVARVPPSTSTYPKGLKPKRQSDVAKFLNRLQVAIGLVACVAVIVE